MSCVGRPGAPRLADDESCRSRGRLQLPTRLKSAPLPTLSMSGAFLLPALLDVLPSDGGNGKGCFREICAPAPRPSKHLSVRAGARASGPASFLSLP